MNQAPAVDPVFDVSYPNSPATDAATLQGMVGLGPVVVSQSHFLVEALGLSAPFAEINKLLIDFISLYCRDGNDHVKANSFHFILRAAHFGKWLKLCAVSGGLKSGVRPGGSVAALKIKIVSSGSTGLNVAGEVGDDRAHVIVGALLPVVDGAGGCALHVRAIDRVGRAERGEMCAGDRWLERWL